MIIKGMVCGMRLFLARLSVSLFALPCGSVVYAQTQVLCPSTCEVTIHHQISIPVLDLSLSEGGAIAGAVLAVWAVGFGVRAVVQVLRDSATKEEN